MLDIIVRDKKGRPVKDLQPSEIEIFYGDAVQQTRSFRRLVTGGENASRTTPPRGRRAPRQRAPTIDAAQYVLLFALPPNTQDRQ